MAPPAPYVAIPLQARAMGTVGNRDWDICSPCAAGKHKHGLCGRAQGWQWWSQLQAQDKRQLLGLEEEQGCSSMFPEPLSSTTAPHLGLLHSRYCLKSLSW